MQHLIERNKKKDAIYSLFHSHGLLKLMQECVWWTVCAKCVQPMWHLTCTQQQLAEIRVIIQFWSNLLGLLIGFHWVSSTHASTNVIPTGFVSGCRRLLSIEHFRCMHLQGASFCRAAWNAAAHCRQSADFHWLVQCWHCPPPEVLFFLDF